MKKQLLDKKIEAFQELQKKKQDALKEAQDNFQ